MLRETCLKYNEQIIKSINNFNLQQNHFTETKKTIADFLVCEKKQEVFGDMGVKLDNFLSQSDWSHPELYYFIENAIGSLGLSEMSQIIQLQKYCKRKKLNIVQSNLSRLFKYFVPEKVFLSGKSFEYLEQSKIHTRFLPSTSRWETRSKKKAGKINGAKRETLYTEEYQNLNIFSCYHHNSEKIKEVLSDLENKYQIFLNIKCELMAKEIKSAIDRLNNDLNSQSLGFHRITLNSIAKNYINIFQTDDDIKIFPVEQNFYKNSNSIHPLVQLCDNFPAYGNEYAAFDHYAVIKTDSSLFGVLVGERDTQTFFIGYYHE